MQYKNKLEFFTESTALLLRLLFYYYIYKNKVFKERYLFTMKISCSKGLLEKAISKLFALSESYPELKANTNFQHLQQELTETESKIASARQFYNDTVLMYNNKVEMVPSNIIASLFKFKKEAFFEANETERENVQVKF